MSETEDNVTVETSDEQVDTDLGGSQATSDTLEGGENQVASGQTDSGLDSQATADTSSQDVIYDPNEYNRLLSEIPEDNPLRGQVKSFTDGLLSSYNDKSRTFADDRKSFQQKVDAFDNFQQNPLGTMQTLAAQQGYQLVPNSQQQGEMAGQQPFSEGWEPQSWGQVRDAMKTDLRAEIMQELKPMFNHVQTTQASNIEKELDGVDPTWRRHEDKMMELMKQHPTLSQNAALLYRMAVPQSEIESKATQAALAKLEKKGKTKTQGSSTTTKTNSAKPGPMSFDEIVAMSRKQVASGNGILSR